MMETCINPTHVCTWYALFMMNSEQYVANHSASFDNSRYIVCAAVGMGGCTVQNDIHTYYVRTITQRALMQHIVECDAV